jgi:hypothetical protein
VPPQIRDCNTTVNRTQRAAGAERSGRTNGRLAKRRTCAAHVSYLTNRTTRKSKQGKLVWKTQPMAPRTRRSVWRGYEEVRPQPVTDGEESEGGERGPSGVYHGQSRMHRQIQRLPWMRPRGNVLPLVGQQCVIVNGDRGRDIGQMGVVTEVKAVMMEITFRHGRDGRMQKGLKRPGSVIMLEDGLELVQGQDGTVWVQRMSGIGQSKGGGGINSRV